MAVVAKPFSVGDLVRWTSAAGGVWRHHVGVIVAVVPAGAKPYDHLPAGRWSLHFSGRVTRREASFLVALKSDRGRGAGQLYRPRVRHLLHFTEGSDPVLELRRRRARSVRSGLPVPARLPRVQDGGRRLANSATFSPRVESRALVLYRPRWSRRDRIIAAVAAPVFLALLALLVVGMQQVTP